MITVNSTSIDHIIANFMSGNNEVTVDLRDIDYTVNVLDAPALDVSIVRDGMSAYQIAVKNGFVGNEQVWIDSLGQPSPKISALDSVNKNIVYAGFSSNLNDVNSPIWDIYKLNIETNEILYLYNQVWSDREILIWQQ